LARSTASSLTRSLVAGGVLAVMMGVLAFVGDALGVDTLWPVLLAAGLGMVIGVPRAADVAMVGAGAIVAIVGSGAQLALLPALPSARAAVLAASVLLLALTTGLSRGRLPLGVALVGWGATTALLEPAVAASPTAFLTIAPLVLATVLACFGLGLLAAQVVTLLAVPSGDGRPGAGLLALIVAGGIALGPLAPAPAQAQTPAPVVPQDATMGAATGWTGAGRGGSVEGTIASLAHRQVVLVPTGPDGRAGAGLVITQLHVDGVGPARITLEDQATAGLRDTGAFRAPRIEGTTVVHELDLGAGTSTSNGNGNGPGRTAADGPIMIRTVATLERELPVTLDITYTLGGTPVTARELVGRSGRIEITYTLTNRTAEPREVRYFDGLGRTRTDVREVAVPMGATVALRLAENFSDVKAPGASVIAGDGTGATQINASLALFGPSGAATRSLVVSADVHDAVVPAAAIRVVPLGARTSPDWRASAETLGVFGGALDAASAAAGLLATTASALDTFLPSDGSPAEVVLDQLATIVAGLGAALNDGAAGVDGNLAWLAAQDARFEAGEGFVHGVLADADVTVVYAFDVAGLGDDGGPALPVRLAVGLALFAIVALIGRSVAGRTRTSETSA
jgi:hypothetical protein